MKYAVFHNLPSGGALRSLYDKLVAAGKAGHTVTLFTLSSACRDLFPLHQAARETVVESVEAYRSAADIEVYHKACERIASRINDGGFDVTLIDKCRLFGSPAVLRYLKKDHVYYCHEPLRFKEYELLARNPLSAFRRFMRPDVLRRAAGSASAATVSEHGRIRAEDRRNLKAARRVMTNSRFTARWIRRVYGVTAAVNYQGVDHDLFRPLPTEAPRPRQVLSVGRLSEVKGYDLLLGALSRIPLNERPSWTLVADSVDEAYADAFARRAKQKEVRFELKSGVGEHELTKLYQESALVLCASYNEPFGLVPLEAMACGTPVIAVAEGGYRETVRHKVNGWLLPRRERVWAETVRRALDDTDERARMGRRGRRDVVDHWDTSGFCRRLEESFAPVRKKG